MRSFPGVSAVRAASGLKSALVSGFLLALAGPAVLAVGTGSGPEVPVIVPPVVPDIPEPEPAPQAPAIPTVEALVAGCPALPPGHPAGSGHVRPGGGEAAGVDLSLGEQETPEAELVAAAFRGARSMLKLAVQYELHHAFRELEAQGGAPDDLLGFRCRVTLGALHFVRLAERDHLRALADTHGIPEVLTLGLLDPA